MKEGLAGLWADNKADELRRLRKEAEPMPTFFSFVTDLDNAFTNTQEVKEAQHRLKNLWQGSKTAEEFFQLFDSYKNLAGYIDEHDSYLMRLCEQHFDRDIGATITIQPNPPTTYDEWKRLAIIVDNQKRSFHSTSTHSSKQKSRWNTGTSITRTSSAITFGGSGQPMEIDRTKGTATCFR
jgi:hypothetical protein